MAALTPSVVTLLTAVALLKLLSLSAVAADVKPTADSGINNTTLSGAAGVTPPIYSPTNNNLTSPTNKSAGAAAAPSNSVPIGSGDGGSGRSGDRGSGGPSSEGGAAGADPVCDPLPPLPSVAVRSLGCVTFKKMCIDQQQFITYDEKYNPRLSTEKLPSFDVKDVVYNWPNPWGNGDKFQAGRDIRVARVVIRPNTSEEASDDTAQPVFSTCTTPLVLWQRWMYNVGEVFESSFVRMFQAVSSGQLDPRVSLVLATPHGLRAPRFMDVFFRSIFVKQVTTLAALSQRPGPWGAREEPSNATAEGWRVRCFERVYMCKIHNRKEDALCAAGEHLLKHYGPRLPDVRHIFHPIEDRDTLKVVFASRPNATGRTVLNEMALLTACNRLDPEAAAERAVEGAGWGQDGGGGEGGPRYRRVKCVAHVFGRDMLYDMAIARATDVLVATHGAAGYHSFYMPYGSSLVEVLPYKFSQSWVNQYYARMLQYEKKVFYWSIWITSPANSAPSSLASETVFRTEYEHREQHVWLPWRALRRQLGAILRVGGQPDAYAAAYKSGGHSISEELQPVEHWPLMEAGVGWAHHRPGGQGAGGPEGQRVPAGSATAANG